ncbi:phosphotransferase [Phytoactinopolyspora endophytica]|uniref:phosphotransferase n=1 Tax=Phytoactinopolyspora endophytica TaxID=1642495 RepID=UPI00101C21E3|nr:phosphotransferase [Phytoactinopolyspora endophytica]
MLPLGLSMLWESVEPDVALKERFGFDSFGTVTAWASMALDETWGISVGRCSRMVISDHNAILWVKSDQGDLVVKWSRARERFTSLEASTRLLRTLAERGIPVASPIATADGLDRVTLQGPSGALSVTVLPELTGDWLDAKDHAAVLSAGACLAEVHRALGASHHDVPPISTRAKGLNERIDDWLARRDRGFAPEASRRLKRLVSRLPELDDEPQLVHNDFRAANILTRDSKVVGVLDFDDVVVEHRVKDLAKACVYLGTRFTEWQPTPTAVRQTLRAGYESVRPLSPAEARWFETLVLWQGLQAIPGENDTAGWASAL